MCKVIKLKELHLKNFKGIKKLRIIFGKTTDVYGDNASGKTTVFDAFIWVLFGKDSRNRKDFSIKTYDSNGRVIPGIDHEVEAVLIVNGEEIRLKKVYKEKWTKKRGQANKTLTGHITNYFINDIPIQKKEYVDRINNIVEENVFKLLTNPLYFNNILSWKERREILMTVVGDIPQAQVINSNEKLEKLCELLQNKTLEDLRKTLYIRKKKLNEEIMSIPYRLDEINNSLENITLINFVEIENKTCILNKEIKDMDIKLAHLTKDYAEIDKTMDVLFSKKDRMREIKSEHMRKSQNLKNELQQKIFNLEQQFSKSKFDINIKNQNLINMKENLITLREKVKSLREEWFNLKEKTLEFGENDFVCPTCGRELPKKDADEKRAEMIEKFQETQNARLAQISNEGKKYSKEINTIDLRMEKEKDELNILEKTRLSLEEKIEGTKRENENFILDKFIETDEYKKLKEEINRLEQVKELPDEAVINKLKIDRTEKIKELDKLKDILRSKEQYEKAQIRIEELEAREKELGNMIAGLESQEFMCEEFIRTKVDLMEERINSKFSKVKFKLFNTLVNGAIEECCDTLINGVPYEDANTAAKFNAGMDIINTLTEHFKVNAPIFIDNRESINELIESKSQIVNLRVSEDSVLVVDVEEDNVEEFNDVGFSVDEEVAVEGPGF
ncbi:AAA family ATPase [Clostridium sediminicola]|uniref:recombinase RecF n=1 Tax=Clostridium sediminicola TaxID=3114879 RepID=UPI0031F23D3F